LSRLRRKELIPEDEPVVVQLMTPKLGMGKYGRQVEVQPRVVEGAYKGTQFKDWFSFGKDKDTEEEYVPYGGPLHSVLLLVTDDVDEVLEDEELTDRKYEQFIKKAVKDLDGLKLLARIGVKAPKDKPENKRNYLVPGTIGPYVDPDQGFNDLDMDSKAS
jgi:hypothetical protein